MTEYTLQYYAEQIDKVRMAQDSARSDWSRQWLRSLEQRLERQLSWKMAQAEHNRSYTIDTTALEHR